MADQRETATAVVLIALSIVMFAVWAAAEFKAKIRQDDAQAVEADRDDLAVNLEVLRDRLDPATKAAFADLLEQRLRDPREELAEVRYLFATYPNGGGAA